MNDTNSERINRSIERLTLLQRVMQGQLCDAIHHFDVDVDAGFKGSSQHVLTSVRVAVR